MMDRIIAWLKAYPDYKHLPDMAAAEKDKGGLKESVILIAIAQFLTFVSVSSAIIIAAPSLSEAAGGTISTSAAIIALLKLSLIGLVIFYIISGIFYAAARLLGGKGSFASQSYVLAVFSLCNNMFSFPLTLFSQVPPVGIIAQLLVALIGIYGIYAQYTGIKSVHQLSSWRAGAVLAATWLLLLLVTTIIINAAARYLPAM